MKIDLGHKSLKSERYLLQSLIPNRRSGERVIIHHVTDTSEKLQLEVERHHESYGIKFERIIL